jgi:predicted transcriptional regulator
VTDDIVNHVVLKPVETLMIRAENVAIVSPNHSLDHALLVLTNSGYSAIPVLDRDSVVQGTINTNLIMNAIAGLDGYDVDSLHELTVEAVMSREVPTIQVGQSILKALELTINRPFLCVEDESGRFTGLLTRKSILGLLYRQFREMGLKP